MLWRSNGWEAIGCEGRGGRGSRGSEAASSVLWVTSEASRRDSACQVSLVQRSTPTYRMQTLTRCKLPGEQYRGRRWKDTHAGFIQWHDQWQACTTSRVFTDAHYVPCSSPSHRLLEGFMWCIARWWNTKCWCVSGLSCPFIYFLNRSFLTVLDFLIGFLMRLIVVHSGETLVCILVHWIGSANLPTVD